jgi:Lipocalin-like domain
MLNCQEALMTGKVGRASTTHSNNASAQGYSLVGSYKLVSSTRKVVDTGEVFDIGKQPNGYIIYTSDNRMLVLIVSDKNDRPAPESFVG